MSSIKVRTYNAKDAKRRPLRWLGHSSLQSSLCVSACHPRASRPEILMCFPSRSFASLEDDTMGGENDNGAA